MGFFFLKHTDINVLKEYAQYDFEQRVKRNFNKHGHFKRMKWKKERFVVVHGIDSIETDFVDYFICNISENLFFNRIWELLSDYDGGFEINDYNSKVMTSPNMRTLKKIAQKDYESKVRKLLV